jgi:hypothetical protein
MSPETGQQRQRMFVGLPRLTGHGRPAGQPDGARKVSDQRCKERRHDKAANGYYNFSSHPRQ